MNGKKQIQTHRLHLQGNMGKIAGRNLIFFKTISHGKCTNNI